MTAESPFKKEQPTYIRVTVDGQKVIDHLTDELARVNREAAAMRDWLIEAHRTNRHLLHCECLAPCECGECNEVVESNCTCKLDNLISGTAGCGYVRADDAVIKFAEEFPHLIDAYRAERERSGK